MMSFLTIQNVSAESCAVDDVMWEYSLNAAGEATITNISKTVSNITIPEKLDGHQVIGMSVSFAESNISSVTFPKGFKSVNKNLFWKSSIKTADLSQTSITIMPDGIFQDCKNLTEVKLPEKLVTIEANAFSGCEKLTAIELPAEGFQTIGVRAFANSGLEEIAIPNSMTEIGNEAFYFCKSLTKVTFDQSNLKTIGDSAFISCTSLKTANIENTSLETIGKNAFTNCKKLSSIKFPTTLKTIGNGAFSDCESMNCEIYFYSTLESIGQSAFSGAVQLQEVHFGQTAVKAINESTFSNCASLKFVDFGSTAIETIGDNAFADCINLCNTSNSILFLPTASLKTIGAQAFYNAGLSGGTNIDKCTGLISIGDRAFQSTNLTSVTLPGNNGLEIGEAAFSECTRLKSLTLSEGITSIGTGAFLMCSELANVAIPASLKDFGSMPFLMCTSLATITVSADNENYCSVDGVVYDKNKTKIIMVVPGKTSNFVIPDTVTSIDNFACAYCMGLTGVEIPASVESIGMAPFAYCISLKKLTVAEENSAYTSENNMIFNKDKTTLVAAILSGNVVVPKNIMVSPYAFMSMYESIILSEGVTLSSSAFAMSQIGSITLPKKINVSTAFAECTIDSVTYNGSKKDWKKFITDNAFDDDENPFEDSTVKCLYGTSTLKSDNTFTVEVDEDYKDKTIVIAFYKNGVLTDVQKKVYAGEALTFTAPGDYTDAKTMVWNSILDIKPLCKAEISSNISNS